MNSVTSKKCTHTKAHTNTLVFNNSGKYWPCTEELCSGTRRSGSS